MADAGVDDLHLIVLKFLDELPQTVRPEMLLFIVPYALDSYPGEEAELFLQPLREALTSRRGMRLFGATLRIIAAIDYVLGRNLTVSHRNATRLPLLAQNAPPHIADLLERTMTRAPLTHKHLERLTEKWRGLRADALSEQSLQIFEDRCMAPPFFRPAAGS